MLCFDDIVYPILTGLGTLGGSLDPYRESPEQLRARHYQQALSNKRYEDSNVINAEYRVIQDNKNEDSNVIDAEYRVI